jgi:hypothetical protein
MLLVQTPDRVKANVLSYPKALQESPDLQERLAYARAWYAVRDSDGWVFAPSKWAGYSNMTAVAYLGNAQASMDGRKTEKHLKQWFNPLDEQSPEYAELHKELAEFAAEYGKQPSAMARISVISDGSSSANQSDDLVELIVRVVKGLEIHQQAKVRSALRI